jgi:hypothetical protein
MSYDTVSPSIQQANQVFHRGLKSSIDPENRDVLQTGTNSATSSFKKAGLCGPFDYNNWGWLNAFETFGKLQLLLKKEREGECSGVAPKKWVVRNRGVDNENEPAGNNENESSNREENEQSSSEWSFSNEEIKTLREEETHTLTGDFSSVHVVFICESICNQMIRDYLNDEDRDKNNPPIPSTEGEKLACRVFKFVSSDEKADTTVSKSALVIEKEKGRTFTAPFV